MKSVLSLGCFLALVGSIGHTAEPTYVRKSTRQATILASLQASGEVLAISPNGEADVQLGKFRLKLPLKRPELRQKAVKETPSSAVSVRSLRCAPISTTSRAA